MIDDSVLKALNSTKELNGVVLQFGCRDSAMASTMALFSRFSNKTYIVIEDQKGISRISDKDLTGIESDKLRIGMRKADIPAMLPHLIKVCGTIGHIKFLENIPSDLVEPVSFAYVDTHTYPDTMDALKFILDNSADGTVVVMSTYDENKSYQKHLAITEFLGQFSHRIEVTRQRIVNGHKEQRLTLRFRSHNLKSHAIQIEPISIAIVMKTGGDTFDYKYVNAIAGNIKKFISVPHKVVCLTDNVSGIDRKLVDVIKPLRHNLPKWWSKMELFHSENFDTSKVLYFDLDTVIVDNIDHIAKLDCDFIGIRDFYDLFTLQTGMMMWKNGQYDHIFQKFIANKDKVLNTLHGDHEWIGKNIGSYEFMQDIYPNHIISYKKHNPSKKMPEHAKVICFHGNPRPHAVNDQFVIDNWKYK